MKTQTLIVAFVAAGVVAAGGYGAYRLGMNRGMQMAGGIAASPAAENSQRTTKMDPAPDKKVLYWHDPMVPGQKFDKPGKSPFMDMQLVPVYADGDGDEGKVTISPRVQQNLGVRTAEVTKGTLTQKLEAAGSVAYNERDVAMVTARSGRLRGTAVRARAARSGAQGPAAGRNVRSGLGRRAGGISVGAAHARPGHRGAARGARQRMRLAGMNEEQIRLVESTGKVHPRLTVTAPIGGVVAELGAREGMTVMAGAPLFRINGLGTIWVNAEVPENLAAQVRPGNTVEARTPALPRTGLQRQGRRDFARSQSCDAHAQRRVKSPTIPAIADARHVCERRFHVGAGAQGRAAGADRSGDPDRAAQGRDRRAGKTASSCRSTSKSAPKRTARPKFAKALKQGRRWLSRASS